jgi:hypothetical protein
MTFLQTPRSYARPPSRVRRNPNASVYEQGRFPDEVPWDDVLTPNGYFTLNDAASDAMAQLNAAGPRGAMVLGAAAGFLLFGGRRFTGALIGSVLGYFGGKYLVNFASKALAVSSTVTKVETAVEKVAS